MKKRERRIVKGYIREIADLLGARDWDVALRNEPCDDDWNAQVRLIYGRKRAEVRVHRYFAEMDAERIRQTIVHEVVHFHFAATSNQAEHDLKGHLSEQARDVFFSGWLRNLEYGIDGLAVAVAPHMPLIDWSKA